MRCRRCHRLPAERCGCGRYPENWAEFSRRVRFERAGGRCECTGECGLHRGRSGHAGPGHRCIEMDGQYAVFARGIIRLTVAHLCNCNPLCADPAHCLAMCNRCHLRVDADLHRKRAAATRMWRREESGQKTLRL